MRSKLYPFKFDPILKKVLWGGNRILSFKGIEGESGKIGESWEISGIRGDESIVAFGQLKGRTLTDLLAEYKDMLVGERVYMRYGNEFPLLLKFIHAEDDLSIQVHPNDEMARKKHQTNGKTEFWYVIDAEEGAGLYSGFNKDTSRAEVEKCIKDKTLPQILNREKVSSGDAFFLPAGRIHSIGKGIFLAEIQQSSDVTYRVWDYDRLDENGKLRDLHVDLALDAFDFGNKKEYKSRYVRKPDSKVKINECSYFTVNLMEADTVMNFDYGGLDSFVAWMCIGGNAVYASQRKHNGYIKCGETVLFPACDQPVAIIPACENVKILEVFIA